MQRERKTEEKNHKCEKKNRRQKKSYRGRKYRVREPKRKNIISQDAKLFFMMVFIKIKCAEEEEGGSQAFPQLMKGVPVRAVSMWFFMSDHKQPLFRHSCVYLNLCLQHLCLFMPLECKPAAGPQPGSITLWLLFDILGYAGMRPGSVDYSVIKAFRSFTPVC